MYLGIDLGGTNIAAGIVDENGKIIYKSSLPTLAQRPVEEIADDMAALCFGVIDKSKYTIDDIEAVGIGCPGTIDSQNGTVIYANNLPMRNTNLCKMLEERLHKKVSVENDANAAAFGEYAVNGNNAQSFVLITLGTGVGGGIILDGKLYHGFNGGGGEIGHMLIEYENSLPCTCGNKGCWEAYASVTALIAQTKEAMEKDKASLMNEWCRENGKISGRTAFECAKKGDKTAAAVVQKYIEYIGAGLVSLLNIFQPEIVMIGGGISREGEYLLGPLREYVYDREYNKYSEKRTKIEAASLFNDAGIIGAALCAQEI